jgi:hypothetical protein
MMNVTQFVENLGGNRTAAKLFSVGETAVCNWKRENRVPAKLHLRIVRLCAERGIAFNPERPARGRV